MPRESKKKIKKEDSNLEVTGKYYKFCPHCKHNFYSDVRHQKYCCPEHAKAAAEKKKTDKKRYDEIAPYERLRVAAHSLAVRTWDCLVLMGIKEDKCYHPDCNCTEGLEVHHKDLNWLNGTPSNLIKLCHKHHKKAHSDLEKKVYEEGKVMDEFYSEDFLPFARIINKEK